MASEKFLVMIKDSASNGQYVYVYRECQTRNEANRYARMLNNKEPGAAKIKKVTNK